MKNQITVVKSAGFCFGVQKAVTGVYAMLDAGEKIAVLGELIHNPTVNCDLCARGVLTVDTPAECPKDMRLVIRTHGIAKDVQTQAESMGLSIEDLTCPFVKKIHNIVERESQQGRKVLIIGDESHPEVRGIMGWCATKPDVLQTAQKASDYCESGVSVVCQTTFNQKNYENIVTILKKNCQDICFFDTICNATQVRQDEAAAISAESDVMFVIGGKSSSNTRKLYEICAEKCAHTYLIENFEDIPQDINYKNKKIGITAGASTPSGSIEEVKRHMEEIKTNGEVSFEEALEETLKTLNTGDVVEGVVVDVTPTEVIVDLGFKSDGIIPASELTEDPDVKPADVVKVGETIEVFVVGVNDGEGKTLLSKKKLDAIAGWKKIEEALENETILAGKVVQAVNGGIIVLVEGTRVFVPARQASDRFTPDLNVFVNQNVELRITEINTRRRRVSGSILSVLKEKKKALEEAFWASAEAGKQYTGVVKSIMPFGAFVDIGGVDGLVHISELSWNRIKDPSEVVAVGDTLEVYIKDINAETKKISLGYKKDEDNPWTIAKAKFNEGDVVSAKVVRFMSFGAFVELLDGVDGLIHISQIANKRIEKPESELKIGQVVEAKIIKIDWEAKRISLSIRALLEPEVAEEVVEEVAEEAAETAEE